jgi:hypothetical protein
VITDEKWPVARLIPISSASGVEAQERRLASALLAVMAAVPEFGYALLKPLGAPSGKFETFIEVPFKLEGKPVRPDGVIVVTRAGKSWSALLEAKIATTPNGMSTKPDPNKKLARLWPAANVSSVLWPVLRLLEALQLALLSAVAVGCCIFAEGNLGAMSLPAGNDIILNFVVGPNEVLPWSSARL